MAHTRVVWRVCILRVPQCGWNPVQICRPALHVLLRELQLAHVETHDAAVLSGRAAQPARGWVFLAAHIPASRNVPVPVSRDALPGDWRLWNSRDGNPCQTSAAPGQVADSPDQPTPPSESRACAPSWLLVADTRLRRRMPRTQKGVSGLQ